MIPLNRHGPGIALRKIKRWFEPNLDPDRVTRVFDEFDRVRGYEAWQAHCRTRLTRPLPPNVTPGSLITQGYASLKVMDAAQATQLLASVSDAEDIAHQHAARGKESRPRLSQIIAVPSWQGREGR